MTQRRWRGEKEEKERKARNGVSEKEREQKKETMTDEVLRGSSCVCGARHGGSGGRVFFFFMQPVECLLIALSRRRMGADKGAFPL